MVSWLELGARKNRMETRMKPNLSLDLFWVRKKDYNDSNKEEP